MQILIVEDEPDIGCVMTKMIANAGHQPVLAADGLSAVVLAEETPPDAIFMDIMMPGINGYDTARKLRRQFGDNCPIYEVSATTVEAPLAKRCGFTGTFTKPLTMASLMTIVDDLQA